MGFWITGISLWIHIKLVKTEDEMSQNRVTEQILIRNRVVVIFGVYLEKKDGQPK